MRCGMESVMEVDEVKLWARVMRLAPPAESRHGLSSRQDVLHFQTIPLSLGQEAEGLE